MHAQDLIIIASVTGIALLLMGYYIRKLILRAFDRHYDAGVRDQKTEHGGRIALLNTDINALTQLRTREAQELDRLRRQLLGIKATPFTSSDYRHLTEITQFLALALQTWKALKGTEASQTRAEQLIKVSQAMAHRVFHTVEMANSLNGQPLDTQLIEWLDKHGTFNAEPEMSSISFPHEADTEGYSHLRDALREAYELDMKRQAIELRQQQAEDAA
ncbi:hypothetical protein J3D48_004274 [Pseudomonas fluorescens]|uniref:hypothetical protein n=1 Tax=Pseudomonas fluorescens TaxID=294 RepID=UPI00209D754B|nr:hypothetical protein [Pseudomonas fluorescens]MCP1487961.1 hypothetical protein [Pseudomonas fluorescens]